MVKIAPRLVVIVLAALPMAGCFSSTDPAPTPAPSPYAAVARGEVEVPGGPLDVMPMTGGEIESVAVTPEQQVQKGQLLARLDPAQAQADVDVAQARWDEARARTAALALRLPGIRDTARRWESAVKAGAAEGQHSADAKDQLLQLQGRLKVARARERLAHQQWLQARIALRNDTIRAPVAGRVSRVNVQTGSHVDPGMSRPAFVLLPKRPLIVRAEVNESFVHNLRKGMKATLTLEAQPDLTPIAASVARIGHVLRPARLAVDPDSGQRRVVDCILSFTARQPLLIGQHVMVRFYNAKH